MGKNIKNFAVGTAVAGVAGYIAGVLTAPKSGRKTREDLSQAASSGMNDIEKQFKSLQIELGNLVEEAKSRGTDINKKTDHELTNLMEKAKDSKNKVREILSALHDGQPNNKDLKKALKDAKHAIEHISDYLHK